MLTSAFLPAPETPDLAKLRHDPDYMVDRFSVRRFGPEGMLQNTRQLLFAGNETTAKWLGHVFETYASYPDVRREVLADRRLMRQAAEEVMRWQGVTQLTPRSAVEPRTPWGRFHQAYLFDYSAAATFAVGAVQPTMAPWARIMSRVACLNSGK